VSGKAGVDRLFVAQAIAVFGASDRSLLQRTTLENLMLGETASLFGVNPRRESVLGISCVPSAADLAVAPELAVVMVPDAAVEASVGDALGVGAKTIVLPGLARGRGQREQVKRVIALVDEAGATLLGPNCMGVLSPGRASPWIGTIPESTRSGPVAVVTQSGAIGEAVVGLGPRLGLRAVASVGCPGTLGVGEFCDFFATDPDTSAVGLFLETLGDVEETLAAWQRLAAAEKPVVCLKVGETATAADIAREHTSAEVGDWQAFRALAGEAGVICVEDYAEFVETLILLESPARPRGARIGAVTNSGGEAALMADQATRAGIPFGELPPALSTGLRDAAPGGLSGCNPLDAWCVEDVQGTFERVLDVMGESGAFDLLLAQIDQTPHVGELERVNYGLLADALARACERYALPGAIISIQASELDEQIARTLRPRGIALLQNGASAIRAIASVAAWQAARDARRADVGAGGEPAQPEAS
jgi:acyl-CoA synthetase (NDP forming)